MLLMGMGFQDISLMGMGFRDISLMGMGFRNKLRWENGIHPRPPLQDPLNIERRCLFSFADVPFTFPQLH